MRPRFHSEPGQDREGPGRPVELVRVRRTQRDSGDESYRVKARARRRGGRGRRRGRRETEAPVVQQQSFFARILSFFGFGRPQQRKAEKPKRQAGPSLDQQEARVLADFQKHFGVTFRDPVLLKLALTHRSYLSVTGQGPRESNERLEFLGDSVLGLVTSEFLYRRAPDEHEGQLTKTKSLLVSKAILSRRALRMGLGRFVLMSHSEVESGGRQRLSILADAFESVLGAVYLDQGFEVARKFIHQHLLEDSDSIVADKRHTNYKSHLQEYVQSTYRTHPVYRIRSEYGPDHSKHFMVEVMVGRRTLGEGRGHNKKEAEQAAARDALERVEKVRSGGREDSADAPKAASPAAVATEDFGGEDGGEGRRRRRGRRGGRGRSAGSDTDAPIAGRSTEDSPRRRSPGEPEENEELEDDLLPLAEAATPLVAARAEQTGEPIDDDEYDEEEVGEEVDDLDEDEADEGEEEEVDDLDDEDDEEELDEDEDEDDDDDEDDDEDERLSPPAPVAISALPVRPVAPAAPAVPAPPAPAAEVRYGRSGRRPLSKPAAPAPQAVAAVTPVPAPALPVEPEAFEPPAPHEELHVDPYGIDDETASPAVEVIPPAEEGEDVDSRIEEMERAMASFGQRRGPDTSAKRVPFGRKGRRR